MQDDGARERDSESAMALMLLNTPKDERTPSQRDAAIASVQRWRGLVDTQMHFNDMLMRARGVSVSIVIAVFGAAAVSIAQYPNQLIGLPGNRIHIAALVIAFGLLLLVAVFVLDYFYYYRMLLAVVAATESLELESRQPSSPIELRLTSHISTSVSRRRAATVLCTFYGIPFVSGLLFLFYLATLAR